VVVLVVGTDALGDLDRRLGVWFVDEHDFEATLERGIVLDELAEFLVRGGADAGKSPPSRGRLEFAGGVTSVTSSRVEPPVDLVEKDDHVAVGALDLLFDALEPLGEGPAELRAAQDTAEFELHDDALAEFAAVVGEPDEFAGEPLDDRRLPDAGLADQNRIVRAPFADDIDQFGDFVVPTEDAVDAAQGRLAS
jgi:hypothetical protein